MLRNVTFLHRCELLKCQRVDPAEQSHLFSRLAKSLLLLSSHERVGLRRGSLWVHLIAYSNCRWRHQNLWAVFGDQLLRADAVLLEGLRLKLLHPQSLLSPSNLITMHIRSELLDLVCQLPNGRAKRRQLLGARLREARELVATSS